MKFVSKTRNPPHLVWPLFKWVRFVLICGGALSIVFAYLFIFKSGKFDLILKFAAPVLAIYIASSGLMFNRARGMPQGKSKRRSLYAGERALQAFLFSVVGLILGVSAFSVMAFFSPEFVVVLDLKSFWIFTFVPSLVYVQWGFASYVLFLQSISTDLLYPVTAKAIAVRIRNAP